jgi:hypothetical protein
MNNTVYILAVFDPDGIGPAASLTGTWMQMVALTPFHNLGHIAVAQESKQFYLQDVMRWLGFSNTSPLDPHMAHIRTDVTLLLMLQQGVGWAPLPGISGFNFADSYQRYLDENVKKKEYLFSDALELYPSRLERVINPRKSTTGRTETMCEEYLQVALQVHHVLCTGQTANWRYLPTVLGNAAVSDPSQGQPQQVQQQVQMQNLAAYLRSIKSGETIQVLRDPQGSLTPFQYNVASIGSKNMVPLTMLNDVHKAKPEEADKLLTCKDTKEAVELAVKMSQVFPQQPTWQPQPSYCWLRAGEDGRSISQWRVDLGGMSRSLNRFAPVEEEVSWDTMLCTLKKYPLVCSGTTWSEATEPLTVVLMPNQLSVLTWNVLFDRFNNQDTAMGKPAIDRLTSMRYPSIAECLRKSDADIIGLQEVEPPFWQFIAGLDWVRKNYVLSCAVDSTDITPWGVMILCHRRVPLECMVTHNLPGFNAHICPMPMFSVKISGFTINFMTTHLQSSTTASRIEVRQAQLTNFVRKLQPKQSGDHCVIFGDFNEDWKAPPELGMADVWDALEKDDRSGWTIDCARNPMCEKLIEDEFQGRYDKIFYRSPNLVPMEAELTGTEPVNTVLGRSDLPQWLFPSDHFGVKCTFKVK